MTVRLPVPAAPVRVTVTAPEHVPVAAAMAVRAAGDAGLAQSTIDAVRVVAAELAENLHRHAPGGELVALPPWSAFGAGGRFSVLAVDRGDGVEHFERCLVDGYSTTSTMGGGLGAVRRMCDDFDAVSEPGHGTVVRAAFDAADGAAAAGDPHFEVGAFGLPIEGQLVNGDGFGVARRGSALLVLAADGLGHGPGAADASEAAVRAFGALPSLPPAAVVREVSRAIIASRGAAVTVVALDLDAARAGGHARSAGLGNVSLVVAAPDGATRRVATSHGTAGARVEGRITEQSTAFAAHGTLILHTDGLSTRWTLDGRAELLRHAPDVVAAALWRDHARNSDDCLVVAARARPPLRTDQP